MAKCHSEYDANKALAAGKSSQPKAQAQAKEREGSPLIALLVFLVALLPLFAWLSIKAAEVLSK